jgi:cellulose synthase/poly-beta-1,6-N-acetylglucosamine synthase-like glycosyltransferase
MFYAYYFFAGLLVYLSLKSFLGGIKYHRFVVDGLRERSSETPFATIFAPCRGVEQGLPDNLAALFDLEYPAFEIVFVTDDAGDASVPVIKKLISDHAGSIPAKLVIAPKAEASGQKVENLREAVLHADVRSEIYAFVDSDVRPTRRWLRSLSSALDGENVGAATGYRWFLSEKRGLGSELRSAWNASIASALGPNRSSNFCWGGALAIRKDLFDSIGMRDRWKGTLSDDFAVTRAMRAEGLDIAYAPGALTPSFDECSFAEMLEFTTRQMKITRVYGTRFWVMSMVGSSLFTLVMAASLAVVLFSRQNDLGVVAAVATLALVTVFSVGKSWVRLKAVEAALPEYKDHIKRQFFPQCTLWAVTPAIFMFNSFAALLSRRIRWRGYVYELKSPNETVIISSEEGR